MWSYGGQRSCNGEESFATEEDAVVHRKRLAKILRYISNMHQSDGNNGHSFVRNVAHDDMSDVSDFFQRECEQNAGEDPAEVGAILFSSSNFRDLLSIERAGQNDKDNRIFQTPPFTFYAASSPHQSRLESNKRAFDGALKYLTGFPVNGETQENLSWFRLVRLTAKQVPGPPSRTPFVESYLKDWMERSSAPSIRRLLTIERLANAPKVPPHASPRETRQVKSFLKQYRQHLQAKKYQQTLEPIYNRLFEWIQQQHDHHSELVWGLGHARVQTDVGFVNGPLLEVHVEVELCLDGAIVLRPRSHTGVCLNQTVAVAASTAGSSVLSEVHRLVSEIEPTEVAPGQPDTYVSILKQIALALSPGGSFHLYKSSRQIQDSSELVVTEAWCLYSRPKPSSVWARDANVFADRISSLKVDTSIPIAMWSLTHGPNMLQSIVERDRKDKEKGWGSLDLFNLIRNGFSGRGPDEGTSDSEAEHVYFPLPASKSQNQIADLLLNERYPAVVVEGPPGCGKTHSIANMICSYLCLGKRVVVISKNAHALSVLRDRLPISVRDLVVDVSVSELEGMQQLQKTVERLANRISCTNSEVEGHKCALLQANILELKRELKKIDSQLDNQRTMIEGILEQPESEKTMELASSLIDTAPWSTSMLQWNPVESSALLSQIDNLIVPEGDGILLVSGFSRPPSPALISLASATAGSPLSTVTNAVKQAVASIPVIGTVTGVKDHTTSVNDELRLLTVNGRPPEDGDWELIVKALKQSQASFNFETQTWQPLKRRFNWPDIDFSDNGQVTSVQHILSLACDLNKRVASLNVSEYVTNTLEYLALDKRRGKIELQIQRLNEELVDATIVKELSQSFSPEAQSSLIQFAQIAGKSKFSRSSQTSKLTQRQRRKRQEYLDSFDRCCRYIPCWILSASQICDYLPSECLFDLVIVDEASQSDFSVLPAMLRGKQWLVVGDGKQVSPTECFVSEDQIDSLQAALPESPFQNELLPGKSFFDLCSQAFPAGRVVLNEHFRCAEEIIMFSNELFYDRRLVPLRLPLKSERMTPSILDVRVRGTKQGKVNIVEAEAIVNMISEMVDESDEHASLRSIGVISLVGDEQSRLIRGRLLDAVGPEAIARHDILVGDPPMFQGAERDVIFLSMVCSIGSIPAQTQLLHYQRANVAMSRARDRCVLVRSIDMQHVPNRNDVKHHIIQFFDSETPDRQFSEPTHQGRGYRALKSHLIDRGFVVRTMGKVWENALCVEEPMSDTRAAILVECDGEATHAWKSNYEQQKAIERVGWNCLRINALSLMLNFQGSIAHILEFLSRAGIREPEMAEDEVSQDGSSASDAEDDDARGHSDESLDSSTEIVVISSDESEDAKVKAEPVTSTQRQAGDPSSPHPDDDPGKYGTVVDVDFLLPNDDSDLDMNGAEGGFTDTNNLSDYDGDESEIEEINFNRTSKRMRQS